MSGSAHWAYQYNGSVLMDTANSVETTFKKVYDVAEAYSDGVLEAVVTQGATSNSATSGAVAIPITELYSDYTTNATAAIAATIADGVVGQEKWIKLKLKATNNLVVTPAHFNNGTTLTFDATGEVAHLIFVGTGWEVLYTTATVA